MLDPARTEIRYNSEWCEPLGAAGMSGEAAYVFRSWDSSDFYSPGTIDVVRHQKSHLLRAALTYPLARDHNLVLEARKAWNRENIAIFQYNTALLQLSWQWTIR